MLLQTVNSIMLYSVGKDFTLKLQRFTTGLEKQFML